RPIRAREKLIGFVGLAHLISFTFHIVKPSDPEIRLSLRYSVIDLLQIVYLASHLVDIPRLDRAPCLLFETDKSPTFTSFAVILNDLFCFLQPALSLGMKRRPFQRILDGVKHRL